MGDIYDKINSKSPLDNSLAFCEYLNRVHGEFYTPRKARVPKGKSFYDGFWYITFTKDFDVRCDNPDHLPNEKELADFKRIGPQIEFPDQDFPDEVTDEWFLKVLAQADAYYIYTTEDNKIDTIRTRTKLLSGRKQMVHWTHYKGGKWLACQSEGSQRLLHLHRFTDAKELWWHEGEKAATHCQWMADGASPEAIAACLAHPFGAEIAKALHTTSPNGVEALYRADWQPVIDGQFERIVICPDSDGPGESAVIPLARILERAKAPRFRIRWSKEWDESFDLADPFPEEMFKEVRGRRTYTGAKFHEVIQRNEWATFVTKAKAEEADEGDADDAE